MASTAARQRTSGSRLGATFWPRCSWRDTRFAAAGVTVQLAAAAILAAPWFTFEHGASAWVTVVHAALAVAIPVSLVAAVTPALSAVQRRRLQALLGVHIPRPAGPQLTRRGLAGWMRSEATWRQLAYHVAVAPILALGGALTLVLWAAGFGLATTFVYVWGSRHSPARCAGSAPLRPMPT